MKMYEPFYRCPECQGAYFKKQTYVLLDKNLAEQERPIASEQKVVIEYKCLKCAKIFDEYH